MDEYAPLIYIVIGLGLGIPIGIFLARFIPADLFSSQVHNKEMWKWTDWTGQERSIEVNRSVEF